MSLMKLAPETVRLRRVAKAHAMGEFSMAEYRQARREVIDNLRGLRSTLADARSNELATPEKILGVPCHDARVATIDMCLWESTGLPLRYDSEGLKLRALNIDTRASIGEHAFDLPFETASDDEFDAESALAQLAKGDLSGLAPLLHPGLRMPHAV